MKRAARIANFPSPGRHHCPISFILAMVVSALSIYSENTTRDSAGQWLSGGAAAFFSALLIFRMVRRGVLY